MRMVDARGQACPQPVILTRKALDEADELLVIVDNDTAEANVSRMAEKAGCEVEVEHKADGTFLHIVKTGGEWLEQALPQAARTKVVLVASDTLGRGSRALGTILIRGFFHTLNEVLPLPSVVVFMNSGVRLVTEGSEVVDDLRALCDKGVQLLACGTCLDYYKRKDKIVVGQVSNMYAIVEALLQAGSVVSI